MKSAIVVTVLASLILATVMTGCGEMGSGGQAPASAGAKLASPADLADKRIGVLLGSAQEAFAVKTWPNATVLQYKSPSDLALAVKSGKADAALHDSDPLRVLLRSDSDLGVLGEALQRFPIGAGFHKDNAQLRDQFNRFLRQIRQDGVYDDMLDRWMKKGETHMPDIAAAKGNGVLVVGIVSDLGLPFTVVKDGRPIGFDIELAQRFAASLGKECKLADMEFGALIAAIASRKIDTNTSSMFITDERKKRIHFSDPYYEMGTNAFALKKNIVTSAVIVHAESKVPAFFANLVASFESNILKEKRYLLIWDGLKTTVIISILSTLFGTLLGALVCYMRMSTNKMLNLPARFYISILRGTPVLVLLMLIFYVVFASVNIDPTLVAVVAFGMNFAAYVSEIFRSGIESVDKGQTEAGIAMGFTKFSTFVLIVMPQTVRRILPVFKGEFISLVKMTSIVGYIAVQDLTKASDIIRSRTFDAFFPLIMVALLYFGISWLLMQPLEYLERRTDPKFKRKLVGAR